MKNETPMILIVDDNPKNIQVAASIIQEKGYQMAFATNGKDALETVKSDDFDLILLDIMMPEMDGYSVCQQLKSNPDTSEIPVIFLTAKAEPESIVKGFEVGAVDYICKPFNTAELLARVNTHLDLKKARDNLKEMNSSKDKFVSIIAHDLKGAFNGLLGVTGLLEEHGDILDVEKVIKYSKDLNQTIQTTYKLFENLLEWARMQKQNIEYDPTNINVYTIVSSLIPLYRQKAEQKKITMTFSVPEKLIVFADTQMFQTILRNLVSNALKFTFENGCIHIKAEKKDKNIVISVSDTGRGIKKEHISRLFDIESKTKELGTAGETGTGLGLILCREFAEKNSGNIWVESKEGKGSCFFLSLPTKPI